MVVHDERASTVLLGLLFGLGLWFVVLAGRDDDDGHVEDGRGWLGLILLLRGRLVADCDGLGQAIFLIRCLLVVDLLGLDGEDGGDGWFGLGVEPGAIDEGGAKSAG